MKLNKNTHKTYTYFNFNWYLYKIIYRIAFNTFEKKTIILQVNNTK